jgi:hypothetical protein
VWRGDDSRQHLIEVTPVTLIGQRLCGLSQLKHIDWCAVALHMTERSGLNAIVVAVDTTTGAMTFNQMTGLKAGLDRR